MQEQKALPKQLADDLHEMSRLIFQENQLQL